MVLPCHSIEVVDGRHLVLNGDSEVVAVLHQLLDHAIDQLDLGELPLVEDQTVLLLGKEGPHGKSHTGHRSHRSHGPGEQLAGRGGGAVGAAVHAMLHQGHDNIQNEGHGHEHTGAAENGLHIILPDAGVDDVAQASAAHHGGKDRRADGVDSGDAHAGKDDGGGQGNLHPPQLVHAGHAHAGGRLFQSRGHLVEAQHRVAYDGEQGIEGQAHNDGGLPGTHKYHDDTQQSQGGGGLNEVHHPENDLACPGIEVGEYAQGDAGDEGKKQGHNDHGQVLKDHLEGHRSPPPFRMPRGTARR